MRAIKLFTLLAMLLGSASAAMGQVPGVPSAATAAPTAATAATTASTAAAGAGDAKNIWSFFCKTPEQKAQCKARFCNSSIGQYINNMMLPAAAMTGGLIGPCCPDPATTANPEDLKKSATSAQGAAAKIKAEEAQAKAKIEAIEYLATVDCRYYPEAEAGMITGLRAEKNECVRLAAAKALASGCCCSAKVVKALTMSVNCSNKDGFPAEASELVRIYAFVALERCMKKCVEAEAETPPEQPPAVKQALFEILRPAGSLVNLDREILLAGYFTPTVPESPAKIMNDARLALAKGLKVSPDSIARLSGPKNVYDSVATGGSQWRPAGPVVVTDSNSAPAPSATPEPPMNIHAMMEPILQTSVEPPLAQNFATAAMPTVPSQPMTAPFPNRDLKLGGIIPVTQRSTERTPPQEVTTEVPVARPRTGRANLLNMIQDATRK